MTRLSGEVAVMSGREPDTPTGQLAFAAELAMNRLEHLNEIARLFAGFQSVAQTFDKALAVAARTLALDSAILIESDESGSRTMTHWSPEPRGLVSTAARAHADAALSYLAGAGPDALAQTEQAGITALPGQPDAVPGVMDQQRFIVVPLVAPERPAFGVLQVEASRFDRLDLVFVTAIASQLAVAIDRDRAWRRDIARRDHAEVIELTLRAHAEALIAADRQRSEFLSVLADELRTSLAAQREIQQLLRAAAGGDRIDQALATMNVQIQRMAQLIDDLHGLSTLTREQAQVRKLRVEIGGVLRRAAKSGEERLSARGQTLTAVIPPEPAYLEADPARIEGVFETVIDKASLLASPGGRIWLNARFVAARNEEPRLIGEAQVVVTLRDDGAGTIKAILPRVFDLLNPAGRSLDTTDVQYGSGLKLMRRIVELHGGTVSALSSGFGLGSEFEVRLPIGGRHAERPSPERRSAL